MKTILTISDLHIPVQHEDALKFIKELYRIYQPDEVICLGDEVTCHNWSKFQRHSEAPGVEDELDAMIQGLRAYYKLFPKLKVCTSNHVWRIFKRAAEAGLPKNMLKDIRDILNAPNGWVWQDMWEVDGILFNHGELSGNATDLIKHYRRNIVVGHSHTKGGVTYNSNGYETTWALQAGCLINPESYDMMYAKNNKDKPVLGTGIIVNGIPTFIPLS